MKKILLISLIILAGCQKDEVLKEEEKSPYNKVKVVAICDTCYVQFTDSLGVFRDTVLRDRPFHFTFYGQPGQFVYIEMWNLAKRDQCITANIDLNDKDLSIDIARLPDTVAVAQGYLP